MLALKSNQGWKTWENIKFYEVVCLHQNPIKGGKFGQPHDTIT